MKQTICPRIDVIMPVYNVAPFLEQSINSVLTQTYRDFRLIVVDDGSTDDSGEICDKYKNNPQVLVIHRENGGLSAARNTGISYSTAEYIAFIDSDDWLSKNCLEIMVSYADKENSNIVCVQSYLEFQGYQKFTSKNGEDDYYCWDSKTAIKNLFIRHLISVSAWGKLYKREMFNVLRYPEGHIHEDLPLILPLLLNAKNITVVNKALYHYRQQTGSLSRSEYKDKNRDLYKYVVEMGDICKTYPELTLYYENFYLFIIKSLLMMFSSNQTRTKYKNDYLRYRNIIKRNIGSIFRNNTISSTDKVKYLIVLSFNLLKIYNYLKLKIHA